MGGERPGRHDRKSKKPRQTPTHLPEPYAVRPDAVLSPGRELCAESGLFMPCGPSMVWSRRADDAGTGTPCLGTVPGLVRSPLTDSIRRPLLYEEGPCVK